MTQTLDLLLLISFIFLGIPFMYQFSLYLGNRLRKFLWKKKKKEVIFMNLLRGIFYTTAGVLFTLFYREGMQIAMNWVFMIWVPTIAWEFAMWATPYQRNKKSASRWHD